MEVCRARHCLLLGRRGRLNQIGASELESGSLNRNQNVASEKPGGQIYRVVLGSNQRVTEAASASECLVAAAAQPLTWAKLVTSP
jgi:hypothetical protein